LSVDRDVYEAFFRLESVEGVVKILLLSRMLEGGKDLPAHKLEELAVIRKKRKGM